MTTIFASTGVTSTFPLRPELLVEEVQLVVPLEALLTLRREELGRMASNPNKLRPNSSRIAAAVR